MPRLWSNGRLQGKEIKKVECSSVTVRKWGAKESLQASRLTNSSRGHGNMEGYLSRFRLKQTQGLCQCGVGLEDTRHIKEECTSESRNRARTIIRQKYGNSLEEEQTRTGRYGRENRGMG